MMKKIAALAGAGALLLSVALPAFGFGFWPMPVPSNDVNISNWAKVDTDVYTKANTGDNELGGMCVMGGKIDTGSAMAGSQVKLDVNSSLIGCPGCEGDVNITNGAKIYTDVVTKAESGDNDLGAMFLSGGRILTGDAEAGSLVDALVNFTVVGYDLLK